MGLPWYCTATPSQAITDCTAATGSVHSAARPSRRALGWRAASGRWRRLRQVAGGMQQGQQQGQEQQAQSIEERPSRRAALEHRQQQAPAAYPN